MTTLMTMMMAVMAFRGDSRGDHGFVVGEAEEVHGEAFYSTEAKKSKNPNPNF